MKKFEGVNELMSDQYASMSDEQLNRLVVEHMGWTNIRPAYELFPGMTIMSPTEFGLRPDHKNDEDWLAVPKYSQNLDLAFDLPLPTFVTWRLVQHTDGGWRASLCTRERVEGGRAVQVVLSMGEVPPDGKPARAAVYAWLRANIEVS